MNWYIAVLKKYAEFSGRARRQEYWMFILFNTIFSVVAGIIDGVFGFSTDMGVGVIGGLYSLVVLLPTLAVMARRLHDTGRSGWWILVGLVPVVGALILLVFAVQDSKDEETRHGPSPKAVAA